MKRAPFAYWRVESVSEAVGALGECGDGGRLLAGGQSLLALMNLRVVRPDVLIDLGGVGLVGVGVGEGGGLEIGAMTSMAEVSSNSAVREGWPLLSRALGFIASPAVRSRGTVGGSVAFADPAAELPAVLLALGGEVVVDGPDGVRVVGAEDLFVSRFRTVLALDEVMTSVQFPVGGADACGFCEVSRRRNDPALAGAAVTFGLDPGGLVGSARVVLFGVGERPVRARRAERVLLGARLGDERVALEAARVAAVGVEPVGNVLGSGWYRGRLAEVVVRRAVADAVSRLGAWSG